MTKIATAIDGTTTTFDTDEITGIHDRGVVDGKPVVKITRAAKDHLFVFATAEAVVSAEPDISL